MLTAKTMNTAPHTVTIFGSSRPRPGEAEYQTAYELGIELANAGYIVCNGGYGGIMEASAKGVKKHGGTAIGVVTEPFGVNANPYIDKTIVTKTHVERLLKLVELGDAYIVLKGGTGTLLELAFVWEYLNKSIMNNKPIIVIGDFWTSVINTLRTELAWEGLRDATHHVTIVESPDECVSVLNKKLKKM